MSDKVGAIFSEAALTPPLWYPVPYVITGQENGRILAAVVDPDDAVTVPDGHIDMRAFKGIEQRADKWVMVFGSHADNHGR